LVRFAPDPRDAVPNAAAELEELELEPVLELEPQAARQTAASAAVRAIADSRRARRLFMFLSFLS
jgi:hypothetical protein